MRGPKALLNHLVASQFEQGQRGRRFYRALFDMADKVIGVSAEAKASFMSIQLLCTMVSKELQVHVWEALKEYGCLPVDEPEHKVNQIQQSPSSCIVKHASMLFMIIIAQHSLCQASPGLGSIKYCNLLWGSQHRT